MATFLAGPPPVNIQHGRQRGSRGQLGVTTARSPPKQKNTSHVPCKFYPIGQCQAGTACQFSHDMDPTTQNAPCKYFARGSCKFGQGCALLHILPDGRIVNRGPRGPSAYNRRGYPSGPYNGAQLAAVPSDTNLVDHNSILFQAQDVTYMTQPASPSFRQDPFHSNASTPYGSPPNDVMQARSPPRPGLSARDAQMPSSWDSQGISQAARYGPFAASVPGKFGIESPPASLPKAQIGITALRDSDPYSPATANLDGVLRGLGSSPRETEPLTFAKRPLHSERFARPRMAISSSLDIRSSSFHFASEDHNSDTDSQSDSGAGEDLLPSSLHDLIPVEKLRRSSRSGSGTIDDTGDGINNGLHWSSAPKRALSGTNLELKSGSSSPHSASPSRYSAMWAARSTSGTKGEAESNPISAFGHVGSPLRPSNLRTSSTTDGPVSIANGTSLLTSQLQKARLDDKAPEGLDAQPIVINGTAVRPGQSVSEKRASSSFSVGAGRDKIEEETMFSMDEPDEQPFPSAASGRTKTSSVAISGTSQAPAAPRTWASMVAGRRNGRAA